MKNNRTDTIWMVKRINSDFKLALAHESQAEDIAIQYNQDISDDGSSLNEFYVVQVTVWGNYSAKDMIVDKELRQKLLNIYN